MHQDSSDSTTTERLSDFFTGVLSTHADSIMRLAFAQELDKSRAWELTKQLYNDASKNLTEASKAREPLLYLVKMLWARPPSKPRAGNTDIHRLYAGMTRHERFVLTAVDVLGIMPSDLSRTIETDESDIRKDLASARRSLTRFQWSSN